jgi:hypothetical protein
MMIQQPLSAPSQPMHNTMQQQNPAAMQNLQNVPTPQHLNLQNGGAYGPQSTTYVAASNAMGGMAYGGQANHNAGYAPGMQQPQQQQQQQPLSNPPQHYQQPQRGQVGQGGGPGAARGQIFGPPLPPPGSAHAAFDGPTMQNFFERLASNAAPTRPS